MDTPTDYAIVQAMHRFGGSFVAALAVCFDRADPEHYATLKAAFPQLWTAYAAQADRLHAKGEGPQ
jgi:hypothetical protein